MHAAPAPDPFRLDAYDFTLPEAQIAQAPAARRDASRMLVVDRAAGTLADRVFADLPVLLGPDDCLVLNDTRVFPARLVGARAGGGRAELLLVEAQPDGAWTALARPGRRLQPGARVTFAGGLTAEVEAVAEDGKRLVRFSGFAGAEGFWAALEQAGEPPLPPYIRRPGGAAAEDHQRYQTVYARERGAIAAPTAGLHFTPEVLAAVRARGVTVAHVTLHVGYGTFEPVKVEDLRAHRVAAERYAVPPATAEAIARTRARGGRVVAVGTTTTRTLEAAADGESGVRAGAGWADLTITPGYRFRAVDGLVTNFHLPRSSLLVLTATFGGRERVLAAYRHAVDAGYRFYSYGDCMVIL